MKIKWNKKDADLDNIAERIELFMKNNGFEVRKTKYNDRLLVIGVLRTREGKFRTMKVTLSKTLKGVEINLEHGGVTLPLLKFSNLISLFGGGALLLNTYSSYEFYQKIEEKFWEYLQEELSKSEV